MIINFKEMIQSKQMPTYNEQGYIPATDYTSTQPFSYKGLIELIEKTPEAIGILRAIQTDIVSDGFTFIGKKYKVELANKFMQTNRFREEHKAAVFDWLLFGNGALWKGKISQRQVKEVVEAISEVQFKEIDTKAIIDEDVYKTKLVKHAPWSTMQIDLTPDKTSILQFRQLLPGDRATILAVEEIIHAKFMDFNGKVYGFSPMQASINVLSTLSLIKDMNGNFFQNGGVPDWMFILPNEMAGSPNVIKLEQVLRKFKSSRHKHGNMIFTGEVNPIQMNKFDKDMEFRKLAIYYTGILALAFNMPLSRVASIIGGEIKAGAADTDLSEAGYWRGISVAQDYWEDLLNTQLFEPEFDVKIRFNRGYKNDEIKEAQRDVQMMQVLDQLMQRGAITPEYIKFKLHIPDEYFTGKYEIPVMEEGSPFGGKNGSPGSVPKNDMKGQAGQQNAERKKKQAIEAQER